MSNEFTDIEEIAQENGIRFWYAHELAKYLGYDNFEKFEKVINKARASALNIGGIDIDDEFIPLLNDASNHNGKTFKLTRFAVLLCVLSADDKKSRVVEARTALARFASSAFEYIERIDKRKELSTNEQQMVSVAVGRGLDNSKIGIFKDNGYRGMYNMGIKDLVKYKGVDDIAKGKITLYDFMSAVELSANNFRVTLTAEKIKNIDNASEKNMYKAAHDVGRDVRKLVEDNTGSKPEDLPLEKNKINKVKSEIKKKRNEMIKHDTKK